MVNRNRLQAVSAVVVHDAGGREIGRGNGLIECGGKPPGYLEAAAS